MFQRIDDRIALVLSGLVFLAMCSHAMAWTLCPYLSGRSHQCVTENSLPQSHTGLGDPTLRHEHDGGMQMSDMDMEDMAMDMSNVETEDAASSEAKIRDFLSSEARDFIRLDPLIAEVITQPTEPCSHCVMHLRSWAHSPLSSSLVNNSLSQSIVPPSPVVVMPLSSPLTFVDVHDHGPPGPNGSRYILNSTFRI
jgi:hypothetical protein